MSYQKSYQEIRSELRKTNKPLMEKRRRARINVCLNQLKSLVLDTMRKDTSRFSKLEKADVLEMTVKHLKALQKQQIQAASTDHNVTIRYRAGYAECASQVVHYLSQADDVDPQIRARLVNHLANRIQTIPNELVTTYSENGNHLPHFSNGNVGSSKTCNQKSPVTIPRNVTTLHVIQTPVTISTEKYVTMTSVTMNAVTKPTAKDVSVVTREAQPLDLSMEYKNTPVRNSAKPNTVLWRPW